MREETTRFSDDLNGVGEEIVQDRIDLLGNLLKSHWATIVTREATTNVKKVHVDSFRLGLFKNPSSVFKRLSKSIYIRAATSHVETCTDTIETKFIHGVQKLIDITERSAKLVRELAGAFGGVSNDS